MVVTNPTAGVVFQSLLQLQGYVTEPVQSISFDVANTNGVTTNLSGYVTHQTFNTNTHTLATNWFDCTDIELAEGTNRITLSVVDRAGNIRTNMVDCTYLLPTNAPLVGVVWPGNAANLSGNAFTIRGTINDVTATVTAEVTTASTTNTAMAIIESNGHFWIENLLLGSGNNSVKLTAVDVASNTTVTSFDVVKSSVAVTIDPLSESVLNKPFVNVTGTINVNNHKVWVNGVEATLDNTTWTAQNVPLNSGGTAIVQARAIPTTDNNGNGSGGGGSVGFDSSANPSSASSTTTEAEQDKPPEMVVWYYDESTVLEVTEVYPLPGVGHSLQIYDTHWELGESGHWMADHCFRYLVDEDYFNWTTEWWNKEGLGEQSTGGDVGPGVCGIKDPWTTGTFQVGTSWPLEFCDVSVQGGRETEYADYIASVNSRKAETRIWFHTGGKASVKKKSLFAFSGGASGVGNWFWPDFDDYFPFLVGIPEYKQPFPIPNTAVKLGSLGQLDASGQLYRVLGNGKTYDATPIADGYLYYEFGVPGFGKVTPRLNKLTFSAVNQAHFFDVKRDDTAAYYPTPHWETNETTHTVQSSPVLFVSGATVKASDFFLMDVKGSIPNVNLVAKGVASGGETTLKLVGTAGYAGGETWTVTTTAEQSLPANKVDCYKPMHIDWRIAFEGSSEFAEAGENTNHVYVSWHAPTTGNLFHTVVDVACRNAKGKTTEAEIVTGIWGDFTDRSVLKSDGTGPMRYWGEIACTNKETAVCGNAADLVKYADGKCGAWAEFLINTIQVHGLTAVQSTIAYDSYIGPPPTYGYLGNPQRGFYVIDVAGQGGTPCGRKFVNHVVVKSFPGDTNGIYDPSYGNKFSLPTSTESEAAWDDGSVEKFYTLYDLPYPHGDEERTLNNPTGKQVTFTP